MSDSESHSSSKSHSSDEEVEEVDLAKTQVEHDRYLHRFRLWNRKKAEWIPWDPSSYTPPQPPKEDLNHYFYVDSQYQTKRSVPEIVMSNWSKTLLQFLRTFIGDVFFSEKPEFPVTGFYSKLDQLKTHLINAQSAVSNSSTTTFDEKVDLAKSLGNLDINKDSLEADIDQQITQAAEHLEVLWRYVEEQYRPIGERLALEISHGHISFELLEYFFKPGEVLSAHDRYGQPFAFTVKKRYYYSSFGGRMLAIEGVGLYWNGKSFAELDRELNIRGYSGTNDISELSLQHLTPEMRETLVARGKKYVSLAGVHYKFYRGDRIMVDRTAYDEEGGYNQELDADAKIPEVDNKKLHLLPGEVYGLNLATKKWTFFLVDTIEPVVFDEGAWDHLVLDDDVKTLIKGLVDVTRNENTSTKVINDVISGKGGGLIAVLHGPPGTGKTLTAEAVAETLRRPLYMVGFTELSTDPSDLEENLRSILKLASAWDAVLLIDEADVFLEQRSLHEIERNALVSVALRALEYHRGVLFLTSNRIKTFDEAFLSRFSVAISYPELDQAGRLAVWSKFFGLAGCRITDSEIESGQENTLSKSEVLKLAMKPFNGAFFTLTSCDRLY
ncbi:hypothetical protein VKT23_008865 [Stygiomarasmius scandens]|uniref:AAA+ ATPase domain-containing protein n=1 Tax=Marasmiellus scandens TaxID=2682957 RepID=A0ABR1JGE7_9AGAR